MDFGSGDMTAAVTTQPSIRGLEVDMAVWDEIAKLPTPQLVAMPSPLVDGLVVFDKAQLQVEMFKAKIDMYAAVADAHSHALDALRYAMMQGARIDPAVYPDPPPTPPGLTPEQHAAHLAIHDLVSAEEFEVLREEPGFIQVNAHWGAIGKRKFCCELPTKVMQGQRGYVDGMVWHSSVVLNDAWMAQIEGTTHDHLEAQIKKRPWWDRFLSWLADKVF